ncbi:hypothetical protein ARSEF4850_005058 [Beauveria asiatica]
MLRQEATDRGRRCVEVAALLYYNAHTAHKGSWPCILRKFKSRIVVDVLLDETCIKSPLPMRNDWCGKRGLYLVDTSRKIDFADENWAYVTKQKNISAIKKYEKRMRGPFLEIQPFASKEAHEFWKKKLSSQSDVDIVSTLADIANITWTLGDFDRDLLPSSALQERVTFKQGKALATTAKRLYHRFRI